MSVKYFKGKEFSQDFILGQHLWAETERLLNPHPEKSARSFIAQRRAVKNWLTRYTPGSDASNLEQV